MKMWKGERLSEWKLQMTSTPQSDEVLYTFTCNPNQMTAVLIEKDLRRVQI